MAGEGERYLEGQRAFLFNESGSGQVYYPSGKVAVVVASSTTENGTKFQRYFYDNDGSGKLIGSFDEYAVGGVAESGDEEALSLLLTRKGGLLSTAAGKIRNEWKWDRAAQAAGTLPPTPLTIRMNECLVCVFRSKQDIEVTFRCEGVSRTFACGEQLRRTRTYLETSRRVRSGKDMGKLIPAITFKTLQDRQNELTEKLAYLRNLNRPASVNIKHSEEVKEVMERLEGHFDPYEQKVRDGEYSNTFLDGEWRGRAHENTMLEVPRILETGQETGDAPEHAELGGIIPQNALEDQGERIRMAGPLPASWPTELDVRLAARKANPLLRRTAMLRCASGRYSRSLPVHADLQAMKKLPTLVPAVFDTVLADAGNGLVVVVCLREDDLLCVRARQLFEMIHADVEAAADKASSASDNQRSASPPVPEEQELPQCSVYQFPMAHSRFVTERFGIHTLPAYLIFHQSKLVRATVMGARSINLLAEKRLPRVLIVEPTRFKSQLQMEKLLKKLQYESELAISVRDATSFIKFRAGVRSANAVTYYGLLLIDSELDPAHARGLVDQARKAAAAAVGGCTLAVALLPMGSVARSKLHEGVVRDPTQDELIAGVCDAAVTRPLKSTTLDRLLALFVRQQTSTRGKSAAEPHENETHYGLKREDLVRELRTAASDAGKGRYLEGGFKLGMRLAVNHAVFRGVRLEQGGRTP